MRMGIISFLIGVIFSLGLGLSGMTDPNKVLGFLDIAGNWDPSLIFVMGSAIPVYFLCWQIFSKRGQPFFDVKSHIPTRKDIDKKLVIGSALFGVGWGIAGICPGPGIASIGAFSAGALVFTIAYFAGSKFEAVIEGRLFPGKK